MSVRTADGLRGWQISCALALMSLLIVVERLHTLHEPLEADIVTYATIGHEMAIGKRLYSDIWDVKPPGLYVTYELGELVAGHGDRQVWLLGVAAALATLLGVYAAGAALGRRAGLVAALFWTALNGVLVIQANQPNSEVFINATFVAAFALLIRHRGQRKAWLRALAVGTLLAVGSTYKPVVVFLALLLAIAHVAAPPRGLSRADALAEVAVMGIGASLVWGLIFGYAAGSGQMGIYWATNVTMNRRRGVGILFNLYRYLREGKIIPLKLIFLVPSIALVAVGAFVGLRRGPRREWVAFLALQAGVHLMIFSQGGAFHPHSYQMWLPTLAIGVGWALATLGDQASPEQGGFLSRYGAPTAAALSLMVILVHEVPNYFQPASEWARRKYGDGVAEDPAFARAVAKLLRPSETLFEYGDGAVFYYYGDLHPTTLTLWSSHLMALTPLGNSLSEVTLASLRQRPPDLFVVDVDAVSQKPVDVPHRGLAARLLAGGTKTDENIEWTQHPIYKWAMANYRPWQQDGRLAVTSRHHDLFVRRGSDLDRRLMD
jgi:4-amino-4-deoxy-L-arabinose transferase-like glycosyltransferase